MPSISTDSGSISYETHGQGQPLVLIAGLGASRLFWWKQVAPLSRQLRVVILDNRGIGDSMRVGAPFTVADMADDVAAVIRTLNLGPSYVTGISMGGFIAATLTVRHPSLVEKLVLTSTSAGGAAHQPPSNDILMMLGSANGSDVAAYTRKIYTAIAGPGYMQAHPEDMDRIVHNALEKPLIADTYLYQLDAINNYAGFGKSGVTGQLAHISAPTLVIHGDSDPLVPYANGQYLAAHIPGARMLTYSGVGHIPPIEAADRFNNDVLGFIQE
jgi:pimeloyl-ACP methyl ester carboxylesterase